jgi:hypothetical protein
MTLEQDVRREMAAAVEDVRPGAEPLVRLFARRRRRRHRRWSTAAAAAVIAALGLGGAVVVADRDGRPHPPTRADWLRSLREAPPRGSLADDSGFVDTLAEAAGGRVLLADDVPGHRVAVVAADDGLRFLVGPAGAPARELAAVPLARNADADPFARRYVDGVHIGLAPPGCEVATAALPAATDWRPVGSYVVRIAPVPQEWWRVTCAGVVRYEGPARGLGRFGPFGAPVTEAEVGAISAQAGQRTFQMPPLYAYESFATRVGDKAVGRPKLLFGFVGEYAPLAAPAVGGGWWLQLSTDEGPIVEHVWKDPRARAAVSAVARPDGKVYVVGSETAVRARIRLGERVLAEVSDGPVGQLSIDPATDVRGAVVETFNWKGALVGTAPLDDGPAPRDLVDRWDG